MCMCQREQIEHIVGFRRIFLFFANTYMYTCMYVYKCTYLRKCACANESISLASAAYSLLRSNIYVHMAYVYMYI